MASLFSHLSIKLIDKFAVFLLLLGSVGAHGGPPCFSWSRHKAHGISSLTGLEYGGKVSEAGLYSHNHMD